MRTAVIMQPTYLPWLGYFDLMDQSDVFVFLDSVQLQKRSWQQRNRIKNSGGELMLTVPVCSKGKRDQKICEAQIDLSRDFQEKHLRAIQMYYAKAGFFQRYFDELAAILTKRQCYLAELTIEIICWLKDSIGIDTELMRSSSLNVQGKRTELLLNICKAVGADVYLSAAGSKAYIEENDLFKADGMELRYHQYKHPVYKQLYGDFIPHLSAIDLLLNEGDKSISIIRSGRALEGVAIG
jgi:hypothetical protein